MPVYEFYCADCHAIFNFFSRRITTARTPACPRCQRQKLEKQVSAFAISKKLPEQPAGIPDVDETRMEQAMMAMAGEMENLNEDDPKAMAQFMRRFSNMTGMPLGEGAEEALSRMEAGGDPSEIEAELGGLLDDDTLFSRNKLRGLRKKYLPPEHDDTLYPLD